jgi:DNA invertase Pin-like site-specific DNA recombinase
MSRADKERWANCAAVYVRMSTEHQQYSTSNQMDIIREYAKRRGFTIVKVYSDEGKSGLNIQGRDSLAQMIRDVQEGKAEYTFILVYDVSRWGLFQDADESAYYEYICRRAGVSVHYCAEQFENDGSPMSSVMKTMKRTMAGEYSRELSTKVFQGACRLIQLGYKQGGTAGFGLRRMLIDQSGQRKAMLKMGEQKSIQTDRVVLVRGPEDEIKIVRWIFQAFIGEGKIESEIAVILNAQGVKTDFGREWNRATVHQILTNEKYIGNNVYHRTSCKLKNKHVNNPPDKWIRADGAFEGVVEPELFLRAREIILARSQKLTDEEMLEKLRTLLKMHGRIPANCPDTSRTLPGNCPEVARMLRRTPRRMLRGNCATTDWLRSRLRTDCGLVMDWTRLRTLCRTFAGIGSDAARPLPVHCPDASRMLPGCCADCGGNCEVICQP